MSTEAIYLDNHATTPLDERVLEAMLPYFRGDFGNASSSTHVFGWRAQRAAKEARAQVASLIGAQSPREVVFTSGATESNNLALRGLLEERRQGQGLSGLHVITSAIEHPSILRTCEWLEACGASVSRVGVDSEGIVSTSEVEAAIRPQTVLISIMAVNNEVGTIQPISEIGALCHRHGLIFHCDAAQAAGRISIDVERDQIDLLSISAHKLYGPKGIGALYVRRRPKGIALAPQICGGGQEQELRSGTLNVPGVVGFGCAAELASSSCQGESLRLSKLRDAFLQTARRIKGLRVHGSLERRVAGNLSLSFEGVSGEALISALPGLAFSVGSACSSVTAKPSHVLSAMGLGQREIRETLRLGFGRFTKADEVAAAAEQICTTVERLRRASQGAEGRSLVGGG